MSNRQLMVLVGCGAAAAVAAIYKAPIAGLVFTLEVLMIDMNMASIVPILIATITADVVSYILAGNATMFTFQLDNAWSVERVPGTILLGVFCGFVSLYFMRGMTWCESVYAKQKDHPYKKLGRSAAQRAHLLFPLALR